MLDEYFVARHLVARWDENDKHYRAWLPCSNGWWKRGKRLHCLNPHCEATLPPFRNLLSHPEYAQYRDEVLPLTVSLLKDKKREAIFLKGLFSTTPLHNIILAINLIPELLGRCRHAHTSYVQAVLNLLLYILNVKIKEGTVSIKERIILCSTGITAIQASRVNNSFELILRYFVNALHDPKDMAHHIELLAEVFEVEFEKRTALQLRKEAAYVLGFIGGPAVNCLISFLNDKNRKVRVAAAEALGWIGNLAAVEPLVGVLKKEVKEVRRAAAYSLGEIGHIRAVKPLIKSLKDEDRGVRRAAVIALGWIGSAEAVPALVHVQEDDRYKFVRSEAEKALDHIREKSNVHLFPDA